MIKPFLLLVMTVLLMFSGLQAKNSRNELKGDQLKPLGRYDVSAGRLELIGSAVHFGLAFEGSECRLELSLSEGQDHNYIQYELDGVYQKRIRVEAGGSKSILIQAGSAGKHTLWVYKATEAHTGPVFVHRVSAKRVRALSLTRKPLIEFIGNSITCGAAADPSEVPCGQGEYHDQHNAYQAYGPRTARTLGMNYFLSSVSGYGIYRNWNNDGPALPLVYDRLDLQKNSSREWNARTYSPNLISIALGTNDFSNGDGKSPRAPFDSLAYINAYVNFVKKLKTAHPRAQIVMLGSPTVQGAKNEVFVACLNSVKRQIDSVFPDQKPLAIFFFEPMPAKGCSGHPDVQDHEKMAVQLTAFLKDLAN